MAIQPCFLSYDPDEDAKPYGVALINTVTGIPLALSRNALKDLDDAEGFLAWVLDQDQDIRDLTSEELEAAVSIWDTCRAFAAAGAAR